MRISALAACSLVAALPLGCTVGRTHPGRTLYVAPGGSDADNRGIRAKPLRTIQAALARARPGDTIRVAAGDYSARLVTVRSGRAGAAIAIVGAHGARISGNGSGRQVQIRNDYVTLRGFTIADADKLVWVEGARHVLIEHNRFENAGGECIRIKYLSSDVRVVDNTIDHCGLTGFDLAADEHNGEGVYIGTDPGQLDRNPTLVPDTSNHNAVVGNSIATYAAECVDIKEAASRNRVIDNDCSHSRDPDGSGFNARGNDNIFSDNVISASAGAGIRFGGYGARDGTRNSATGNVLVGNRGYGFLVLRRPQGRICGNVVRQNRLGIVNVGGIHPTAPC